MPPNVRLMEGSACEKAENRRSSWWADGVAYLEAQVHGVRRTAGSQSHGQLDAAGGGKLDRSSGPYRGGSDKMLAWACSRGPPPRIHISNLGYGLGAMTDHTTSLNWS